MNAIHDSDHEGSGLRVVQGPNELLVQGTVPERAHADDAGLDLRYDASGESFELAPGERRTVPTGTRISLPRGTVGLVVPRSGLAHRHGITVVNSPGTIDASYRGDVGVVLLNTGDEPVAFDPGDRIAQLLVLPVLMPDIVATDVLPEPGTERGERGFGSTGRQ